MLDLLGFATWAPTEPEVLTKLPGKAAQHLEWLRQHGEQPPTVSGDVVVVERVSGDEVLFTPDRLPATPEEIDRTIALLPYSRQDLLALVEGLPDEILDWDPPYQRFPDWATWRTIRQVLGHIALTEILYYLPRIGYDPSPITRELPADRLNLLETTRAQTLKFLEDLKTAPDRARTTETEDEAWSVRKVLRRLVWHELLHIKNIRRITRDYTTSRRAR